MVRRSAARGAVGEGALPMSENEGALIANVSVAIDLSTKAQIRAILEKQLGRPIMVLDEHIRIEEVGVSARLARIEQKIDDISKTLLR